MLKTSGGNLNTDSTIFMDVREFGFPNFTNPANGGAGVAVRRLIRTGGVDASVISGTTFWDYNPATGIWPVANQIYSGNTRARPTSRNGVGQGFTAYANYLATLAGYDPSTDIPLIGIPCWQKHTLEVTIAKQSLNGFLLVGFANGGGSGGQWYSAPSLGGLGFAVQSDDQTTTIQSIRLRGNPTNVVQPLIPLASPVECVAAAVTIKIEVQYGPIWSVKFSLNGNVVAAYSAAQFGWAMLNTLGSSDDLELLPQMNVLDAGTGCGIRGPYYSRATIQMVRG